MKNGIETRAAVCPAHGDYESRTLVLMGRTMGWSKCQKCSIEQSECEAKERATIAERDRQRQIEQRLNRAGIPLRFRSRSFDTFIADTEAKAHCLHVSVEFASRFIDHQARGTTMIYSGKPGTGKSHLATSICQEIIEAGRTAMYINALDAIRLIRSTWRRDSVMTESIAMASLIGVDLLVIDEVGAQYGTEGEQVILFDIINRRYEDQQPIILLTNQGKEGLKQFLGDRAFDRLREAGKWLAFDWDSHRGAVNA